MMYHNLGFDVGYVQDVGSPYTRNRKAGMSLLIVAKTGGADHDSSAHSNSR